MPAMAGDLDQEEMERFAGSVGRVREDRTFLERFYGHFLALPEAAPYFMDVDMRTQRHRLGASLYTALLVAPSLALDEHELRRLAAIHGAKGLAIPRALYESWVDCLVRAASECDPQFDVELESLWRRIATRGVERMLSYE